MKNNQVDYFFFPQAQIHKAIDCYLEDNLEGYVCSLTLSGAAERFLSEYIGNDSVFSQLKKNLSEQTGVGEAEVARALNFSYNSMKHHKGISELQPLDQALLMLLRAIENYNTAKGSVSKKMKSFIDNDRVKKDLDEIADS